MARLRKEEELRAYERMLNPPAKETFGQRFPNSAYAHLLAENNKVAADQEDEITYAEVNRQLALIINVLVSIVACGIAIWVAARHWSVPARLALSMIGALIVGVAEVVIYMGYLRRLTEAKQKERAKKEVLTISDSWIIEGKSSSKTKENGLRKRAQGSQKPDS
jgi:TMEM199 family protein